MFLSFFSLCAGTPHHIQIHSCASAGTLPDIRGRKGLGTAILEVPAVTELPPVPPGHG